MKGKLLRLFILALVLAIVVLPPALLPKDVYAQSIVDNNVGNVDSIDYACLRKSFYAAGLYWVFAVDYNTMYFDYYTSSDNVSWTAPIHIRLADAGYDAAIWYDGTYIYYCASRTAKAYFRRGIPQSDGTISWSAAEQTISGFSNVQNIAVDSNGYAFVANQSGDIKKNANKDGTWSTASTDAVDIAPACIVPLTSGRMAVFGFDSGSGLWTLYGERYTGLTWPLVKVSSGYQAASTGSWSATPQDDDVHIVFTQRTTNDICYIKYSYSTNLFSGFTVIYDGANAATVPTITLDESTNTLIASWLEAPTANHVYLASSIDSGATWSAPADWVTDIDGIPDSGQIISDASVPSLDKLNIYYIATVTQLKSKNLGEEFIVNTLDAQAIGNTFATLRGEIASLGVGAATERGFYLNANVASMTGATNVGIHTHGSYSTGAFDITKTNLQPLTIYYFIAYASNVYGTAYGNWTSFTTLESSITEPVVARAYMDIKVTGNCTEDYAYLPLTTTTVNHSDLIAGGWINNAATDTQLTIYHNGFLPYTPVSNRLAFLLTDFKGKEVETLRYYLGTEDLQADFDVIVGYGGNISLSDVGAAAIEPGNTFQFTVKGIFDTSIGGTSKYIFYKKDAIRLYVSGAGNLTATIGADALPTRSLTAETVSSGEHKVVVSSDAVNFKLYIDDIEIVGNGTASVGNNSYDWGYMGNNSLVAMEYFKESVGGIQQLWWQPTSYLSGTILPDRQNFYNGTIAWGTNPSCISVLPFGGIASNSIPPDAGNTTTGTMWGVPSGASLSGWFGGCGNVSAQPFYATFASVATEMGMPVCTLYIMMMLGVCVSIGLGTLVFTGSVMISILSTSLAMLSAANTTVVPIWMMFTFAVTAIAILYLSRQT